LTLFNYITMHGAENINFVIVTERDSRSYRSALKGHLYIIYPVVLTCKKLIQLRYQTSISNMHIYYTKCSSCVFKAQNVAVGSKYT